jgi:type I restriction enzyme S subunit
MSWKYQAYPEYKDSGVEWLGEIPVSWGLYRIQETADVIGGFPFDSNRFDPEVGTPLIRIRDINSRRTEVKYDGFVPDSAKVYSGDVLVGMDGDFNVAVWSSGEAALNQRVACVRAQDSVLNRFLYYVLPFNMAVVNDLTYFTTVKHLSNKDIQKTVYARPDRQTLLKIVEFLDRETAKIDALIEKQQRLIALLKEKRQAVISHAVTKGLDPSALMKDSGVEWLGEVPAHWEVTKLGNLAYMQEGPGLRNWQFTDNGVRVICVTNITESGIDFTRLEKFISEAEYLSSYTHFTVCKGDILLSSSGNSWGKVAVYEQNLNVILNTSTIRLNELPQGKLGKEYIAVFLQSIACREQLGLMMTGSCQPNFGPTHLKEVKTPAPPHSEQFLINQFVSEHSIKFDSLISAAVKKIDLMQERRTALISAAVTGKIDVRDHAPAEAAEAPLEA